MGAFARRSRAFKVGITNWPENRILQYEHEHPRHYSEMIVLYETTSRQNAANLERALIDYNWYRAELRNQIGGGGGRHGEGWYFLYMVRRRRHQAR